MLNASDLLGGLLQGGGPRGHATGRLEHAMRDPSFGGASGGSLGQVLGGLAGASRGTGPQGGGGGLLGSLVGMLGGGGRGSTGGMGRGMAMGGLGALAASVLGGGGRRSGGGGLGGMGGSGGNMRGAVGAGGLAVLGMLAMKALRSSGTAQQPPAMDPAGRDPGAGGVSPPEQTTSDHAAGLVLRAMIDAAKADGQVDATERQRLLAKVQEGGADPEAASFLERELARPADPDALAAEARDPVLAAQVYAASLLAIQVDTPAEQAYLRSLAGKLGLEPAVVAQLHGALGAPLAA